MSGRTRLTQPRPAARLAFEARCLARHHKRDLDRRISEEIDVLRSVESRLEEMLGSRLRNLRVLDIGAGWRRLPMIYFAARGNAVTGVDIVRPVRGLDFRGYMRLARANGSERVAKTFARKAMRIESRHQRIVSEQLGCPLDGLRLPVIEMDAARLAFADGTFDFVYSHRVFHHLATPATAAREMARVVAPGGLVYASLLPYTATYGCLDLRMLAGEGRDLPTWPHLRPALRSAIRHGGHVNELRIVEYQELFSNAMPGCEFYIEIDRSPALRREVHRLHEQGELVDFAAAELLATDFRVFWRRPR